MKARIQGAAPQRMKIYIFITLNVNEEPYPSEKIHQSRLPKISVFEMVLFDIKINFIITLRDISPCIDLCFWQNPHYTFIVKNLL